ncbi:MAG: hypothetical protein GY937_28165 [bacterium]|nr:hypothetical protein [bacterium]
MTEYDKQANDFLEKTGTTFKAEYVKTGRYFDDDNQDRDIYNITLKCKGRPYAFKFGQSIACSGRYHKYGSAKRGMSQGRQVKGKWISPREAIGEHKTWDKNTNFEVPRPYSVLSCLQKYEVGTFPEFCSDFEYDTDSRKAEKIYKAVIDEYNNLKMLYTDDELEELQEIQ